MMRKRPAKRTVGSSQGYWQSYSDMMAALLLMFVLIMAFTLSLSLQTFEEKTQIIDEKTQIIDEQQEKLDELIGIKADIILALREAFIDSDLQVDIDVKTGDISLDSSVLFAYDSADLSAEGKSYLEGFLPLYLSVLLSDEFRAYVAEIIIEGHTDTNGEYMYNLNLSQKRAYSVAEYALKQDSGIVPPEQLEDLRSIMTANGRSFSVPVYDENGAVDPDRSRRVEIKFRLQDEEMIEQMQKVLGEVT